MVEIVFLMLILKLPIAYVIYVVWWAVKAEPRPPEPSIVPAELRPGPQPPESASQLRRLRGRPHGRPSRRPPGRRTATARAERRS